MGEKASDTLLRVSDLVVSYGHGRKQLRAVDGVSFEIRRGESLGIIGESGSGKSSLALTVAGIVAPASGSIEMFDPAGTAPGAGSRARAQMVFQDPALALNPRLPVWKSIAEPMAPGSVRLPIELRGRAEELLADVGLGREYADALPGQLSGGQKQRVTIARAVAADHPLVLCDEPVSALDSSLQVGVLHLLSDLADRRALSYLVISHDLTSVAFLASQIAVMYMGQFVEVGPTAQVLAQPRHPYTRALVDAVPRVRRRAGAPSRLVVSDAISDPRNPPTGCRFRPRCPYATEVCADRQPELTGDRSGPIDHRTACHHWPEIADRLEHESSRVEPAFAHAARPTVSGDNRSPLSKGDA